MTTTFAPRPTVERPKPHTFPNAVSSLFANGMRVEHFVARDRLITIALITRGGANAEPSGKEGVATLTAQLRKEGTHSFTGEQFAAELDRIGASFDSQVTDAVTVDTVRVPASGVVEALTLLRESVATPTFPVAEFERIQAEAIDKAAAMRVDPGQRAEIAFRAVTFDGRDRASRPRMGTAESVAALTLEDVTAYARQTLIPSAATLVIGGDIGGDLAELLARAGFDSWTSDAPATESEVPPAPSSPRIVVVDRPGSVQTEIRIGVMTSGPTSAGYAALELATHILGGAFNSRLGRVLREEKGYTYGIGAAVQRFPGRSRFLVASPVESSVTGDALDDIIAILRTLRSDGLTEDERSNALDEMLLGGALRYQTASSLVNERASQIGLGLSEGWLNGHRDALRSTTADAAREQFVAQVPANALSAAFVGDAAQIMPHMYRLWPDIIVEVEKL